MGRKLREVRIDMQIRLGFGSTDQPTIAPILNSFITEAQEQLYALGYWKDLNRHWDMTVPAGTANVAYPDDSGEVLNPETITEMAVDVGTGDAIWQPVTEGITAMTYNNSNSSHPSRYERRADGFEFSPERDKSYTVRVFGSRMLPALRDDDDELAIDSRLVFTVALAAAKGHYGHKDADRHLAKANAIFSAAKWKNAGPRLIRAGDPEPIEPRPVVV